MLYITPTVNIELKNYDLILSIGNRCVKSITLNYYKESYPFDYIYPFYYIQSTPELILKYLNNLNNVLDNYEQHIATFEKTFQRLFQALETKKKILFIFSDDIYNDTTNYHDLCKIRDFIINQYEYNYDNFTIMAIHTNKSYKNTDNMINYSIIVESKYISNNMSTHNQETWTKYRETVKSLMKEIFKL